MSNHCQQIYASDSIRIGQQGLFSTRPIPPFQILLSVKQSNTICPSTISQEFKNKLAHLQNIPIPIQLPTTNPINFSTQILPLYLIHLKTKANQSQFLLKWLNRSVFGIYFFDAMVIKSTQNQELWVKYMASRNQIQRVCKGIFSILSSSQNALLLELITSRSQCSYHEFKSLYEWSYFFISNRSFGYTDEYTLIPILDMINHSSKSQNVQQIISDSSHPQEQSIVSVLSLKDREQDCESDNDNQDVLDMHQQSKKINFLEKYYHVISIKQIGSNQEIFIKYGSRNNYFLMEGYGFVQQDNRYDSLEVYLSQQAEKIYFDEIRGYGSVKFKFKREEFNYQFFIYLKKYYYGVFYHKNPQKSKVIWSLPKDRTFEQFFMLKILKLMLGNLPKLHQFPNLLGHLQMRAWQRSRFQIFQSQIYNIYYLCKGLLKNLDEVIQQQFGITYKWNSSPKLSTSLLEYRNLLTTL